MSQKKLPALAQVLQRLVLLRLFLPLVALSVIVIGGVGYLGEQTLESQQHQKAQFMARIVDRYLDQAARTLDAVARVAEVSPPEDLVTFMQGTWEAYGYFDTLYYLDASSKITLLVPPDPRYLGLDMSNLPYFQQTGEKKKLIISRPFISVRTGNPTVYLVRQLSQGGQVVGELSLGSLQDEITRSRGASQDMIFIMDQSGMLLAHPSSNLVKQQTNQSYLEIFRRGLGGDATLVYEYAGTMVLGSAARAERAGWVVVDQVPLSVALSAYAWALGLTLLASLTIWLALAWNLRGQLQQHVVTPLVQLSRGTGALANGDFSQSKALASIPATFAELTALATDFQYMSDALEARQAALQESEERYRSLFDRVPIGLYRTIPAGQILDINPAFAHMLGYPDRETLLAVNAADLYANTEDRNRWSALIEREGTVRDFQVQFRRCDGTIIWVRNSGQGVRNDQGQVLYYEGSLEDITERKRTEEELTKHREHLEELVAERTAALEQEILERKRIEHALHEAKNAAEAANRAKSVFLANMSHELRTPLNAILGYAQLLKREKNLTAKHQEQLTTIHSSGEHLVTLISDLLDLSRIEAQRMDVDVNTFNLPAFLWSILDASRLKAEAKNLFVQYQELSPIPAIVRGDERKLRQVLLNLLDNAIKYTEHGGVTLRVRLLDGEMGRWGERERGSQGEREFGRTSPDHPITPSPHLLFEVEDTGIGISDEQMQAIFEPFTRVDRRPTEGIGLGLAICRRLVELMGGRLSVTSEVGKGSTFTVELELEVAEAGEGEAEAPENAVMGYHGERKRLLIVDDNIINLSMLVSVLDPLGFEIETADSGEEALHKAAATRPDLILLDLLMPGMDGHESLRRLKRTEALDQVKVIGVSAAVADKVRVQAFAAACDAFMVKPVDIEKLLETLQEQLQLDWIEEGVEAMEPPPSTEVSSVDTATLEKWPPQTVVGDLLEKAEQGDFTRLEAILDRLEGENNEYKGFCETIRVYARRFDDDAIMNYLSQ